MTRKRFSACWGSLHSVPVRAKPRFTEPHAPPIPIKRCLRHRAAASPFHSGPRKADVHRTSCARSGCFNGSSFQRENRSESSPRLQKTFTCVYGFYAFLVLIYMLFRIMSNSVSFQFQSTVVSTCGFIAQNTIFIIITINSTTSIDTQKPILSPSHSQVPKSIIHNSFQFILFTS